MFSFFKKSRAKPIGNLYVSPVEGGNPELYLGFEPNALSEIAKEKYVTMRVVVVKPDSPQK